MVPNSKLRHNSESFTLANPLMINIYLDMIAGMVGKTVVTDDRQLLLLIAEKFLWRHDLLLKIYLTSRCHENFIINNSIYIKR